MARKEKSSGSTWTKREKSSDGRVRDSKALPSKPGQRYGESIPPWPVSELPPFRGSEEVIIKPGSETLPRK